MKQKYKPDFQLGITWKDDSGRKCTTHDSKHQKTGKREVELSESNFIGLLDGMHYYAKLRVPSPWFLVDGEKGSHGGYGGKAKPYLETISQDAERVLTGIEKDAMGRVLGKVGDTTYRFNRPEDARAAAVKMFHEMFDEGWVLVDGDGNVVAET